MATNKIPMAWDKIFRALAFLLAGIAVCGPLPALAQSNIGTAAVVKNQVQGIRGSATRSLALGGSVFNDDSVKTGDASLAQLLFVDQTTFSIASDSEAVLKNVYHGKQGATQRVLTAVTGAFRYVSGVQNPKNTRINFPFGYLTVRGTIIDLMLWPTRDVIVLDEGAITVVPYGSRVAYNMDRPGTMIVVYKDGHVDGPMVWDDTMKRIVGVIPFPVFGEKIWPVFVNDPQWEDSEQDIVNMAGSSSQSSGGIFCPPPGVIIGGFCSP
jgi:hypothetical protein